MANSIEEVGSEKLKEGIQNNKNEIQKIIV